MSKPVIPERCPFCGADAVGPMMQKRMSGKSARPIWEIGCSVFCVSMYRDSKAIALVDWNKRAAEAKAAELEQEIELRIEHGAALNIDKENFKAKVAEQVATIAEYERIFSEIWGNAMTDCGPRDYALFPNLLAEHNNQQATTIATFESRVGLLQKVFDEQAATIQRLTKWISVDDDLPEPWVQVIVYDAAWHCRYIAMFDDEEKEWSATSDREPPQEITYWRQMPDFPIDAAQSKQEPI